MHVVRRCAAVAAAAIDDSAEALSNGSVRSPPDAKDFEVQERSSFVFSAVTCVL